MFDFAQVSQAVGPKPNYCQPITAWVSFCKETWGMMLIPGDILLWSICGLNRWLPRVSPTSRGNYVPVLSLRCWAECRWTIWLCVVIQSETWLYTVAWNVDVLIEKTRRGRQTEVERSRQCRTSIAEDDCMRHRQTDIGFNVMKACVPTNSGS